MNTEATIPRQSSLDDGLGNLRTHLPGTGFEPATLVDLLCWRASHQPGLRAYAFLRDGEAEESSVDYGELDRQARTIAARLQALGVAGGECALLFYPSGLEFIGAFLGCLYAGVVAVPAYAPR